MNRSPSSHTPRHRGDGTTWAGIVVYNPDPGKLGALVAALENQVDRVVIFNNGGCADRELAALFQTGRFDVIGRGTNVGIGLAVNEICRLAVRRNVGHLITFDQDSAPGEGFVGQLRGCMASLAAEGRRVAAVGPLFVDGRGSGESFPVFQTTRFWVRKLNGRAAGPAPQRTSLLITSGMLLSLRAWNKIGGFRDDYFIDHVDTEWCQRALCRGFELYVCPGAVMRHELSDEAPRRLFGRLVLKYSPLRRYYAFRNTVALIRDCATERGLRNYLLATICYRFWINLLIDADRSASLRAMLLGVLHGLTGRMGRGYPG